MMIQLFKVGDVRIEADFVDVGGGRQGNVGGVVGYFDRAHYNKFSAR